MAAILIGDGNPVFLHNLRQMLLAENYEVEVTCEASEILRQLLERSFSALILGNHLKGIDSPELLPILKQIDDLLPVIAIGDGSCLEVERKLRTQQIMYYLVKPVNARELISVVRQAIRKQDQTHEGNNSAIGRGCRSMTDHRF